MDSLSEKIKELRNEYSDSELLIEDLNKNPIMQFTNWLDSAIETKIYEPNAMVLATSFEGKPRSRYVLFKNIIEDKLIFYTHYESPKAQEILSNPNVSGIFYWAEIHRQVRFQGLANKTNKKISDDYFATRPRGGQLSAWASNQSSVIDNREVITNKIEELEKNFSDNEIPRPEFWGGFEIQVNYWEFWQGRKNRTHDRFCYTQKPTGWEIERLSP